MLRKLWYALLLVVIANSSVAQEKVPDKQVATAQEETPPSPTTVDPAQIQSLRLQLEAVQKANEDTSKTNQKNLDDMNKRLGDLRQQLDRAKGVANQIASLTTIVNETSAKLVALEAASQQVANSSIRVDEIRFLAGEEIHRLHERHHHHEMIGRLHG